MKQKRNTRMRRILRWISRGVLVLLLLIVAVFAGYRLGGPSQVQREALALMQKDYWPPQGTNAFPLLWFMRYDIPVAQLDAHMAADVAAVRKRLATDELIVKDEPNAPLLTEPPIDKSAVCEIRAPGCLAKIAAHADAVRAVLARHPILLQRAQTFEHRDFYWNEFPNDYRFLSFVNPGDAQPIWLSAFALQYSDGDRVGALTSTCRNLAAWRRMTHGTNSLIGTMIAHNYADGAIRLFADMLAGLHADEAVPAECVAALQPIMAADVDRCAQMAGEFATSTSALRQTFAERATRPWWDRAQGWLFFQERQSGAWRADDLATYCGEAAVARTLADQPARSEPRHPITQRPECLSSLIGCVLTDIATPAYAEYDQRTLDFAAHLRLAATLLWLHGNRDGSVSERFARRPDYLRSAGHASGVGAARDMLYVDNLHARRDARFELSVAPASAGGIPVAPNSAQLHP
jgi:hypothetical protein